MANVRIDYWRQLDVFDGEKFDEPIHIFGVGATGSITAETLAKLGIRRMIIYDPDIVEDHNIPNQLFGKSDHGKPKVEALKTRLEDLTDADIVGYQKKVSAVKGISGIACLFVDTMDSRKKIWESSLKNNSNVSLVLETRMGAEFAKIFAFNPNDPNHIVRWEKTLFEDREEDEPVCTNRAINSTVKVLAGISAHIVVCYARRWQYPNEVFFVMRPLTLYSSTWNGHTTAADGPKNSAVQTNNQ